MAQISHHADLAFCALECNVITQKEDREGGGERTVSS